MVIQIRNINDYSTKMEQLFIEAKNRKIWFLYGDLGAGKTTLVQQVCRHLGSKDEVTSPTFSLVNEYESPNEQIYHLDLYRLKNFDEALDVGIMEYLDSGQYCLIEWPQLIEHLADDTVLKINIEILDKSSRSINLH